jgi:uncharacterized surface anchored protein
MRKFRLTLMAAFVLALLTFGAVAQAQTTGGNVQPPGIGGEQIGSGEAPAARPSADTLPFTGADLTLFVVIGLGAIAAGATIVRRTRRPARTEA